MDGSSFRDEEGLAPFCATSGRAEDVDETRELAPPKLADASMATKGSGDDRRRVQPDCKYAAFISHYKSEAAMEARFLKGELEERLNAPVFLDSDDLRNLNQLQACIVVHPLPS